jgi:ferredoxin
MKISIDKEKCIKCGLCASLRSDLFVLGEDGIEIIKKIENQAGEKVDEELVRGLKTIEEDCPIGAIKIVE